MTRFRLPYPRAACLKSARGACFAGLLVFAFTSLNGAREQMPAGLWKARAGDLQLQILPKNQVRFFADLNTTALEIKLTREATVRQEYWFAVDDIKSTPHKVKIELPRSQPNPKASRQTPPAAKPAKDSKSSKGPKGSGESEATKNGKPAGHAGAPAPKKESAGKPAAPANRGPLRLGWLSKDAKIILSFLTEYPPAAPEKTKASAAGRQETRAADEKARADAGNKSSPANSPKAAPPESSGATGKGAATSGVAASPPRKTATPKKVQPRPRAPMPIVELLVFQNGKLVHEAIFERGR